LAWLGLDITEMYGKDEAHLRRFWSTVQGLWLQLNKSRLVNVAAIEGQSPAGGRSSSAGLPARAGL
jgi:3,2-trans-enoyl-CoA isomerase